MKLTGTGESALALFRVLLCFNELFFCLLMLLLSRSSALCCWLFFFLWWSSANNVISRFSCSKKAAADNLQQCLPLTVILQRERRARVHAEQGSPTHPLLLQLEAAERGGCAHSASEPENQQMVRRGRWINKLEPPNCECLSITVDDPVKNSFPHRAVIYKSQARHEGV